MLFTEILDRFAELTQEADGGYLALCPAHGDSRPSLRIWRGDNNQVRLHCRAGCATRDVVSAAGLRWTDLFNAEGEGSTVPQEKPAIAGTAHVAALRMWLDERSLTQDAADYAARRFGLSVDQAEELGLRSHPANATVRPAFVSRGFAAFPRLVVPLVGFDGVARGAQGRDLSGDCPGRWLSLTNPQGHRWAAYGVLRGQGGYSVAIVAEGPGDGLTAAATGYDAVFIRGAALAASPELMKELADGLHGQLVVVAGDGDPAGQRFNNAIAEGLKPFGFQVCALPLAAGSDLTAWRESDPEGFASAFHAAVKAAQPVRPGREAAAQAVSAELSEATGADVVSRDQGGAAARVLAQLVERYGESDAMNAHALVAWTAGRIKYAPGLGYYVWNGRVWERSEVKVRQEIHRMGAALVLAGRITEAKGFTMTTRIDALMTELRSVPSVHVASADFDARPDLLAFRNGTVELRTGRLRPHDMADMLTVAMPVDYDASAQCPRWEQFLVEIMPGRPEMPAYLQRLIGYGITGSTSEQCFAVLYGKGANGKSVLTDVLSEIFESVTTTTPFATFEDKGSGGIPNDIAALRGARLVMASEGEASTRMSESVLKRITGKDKVTARFLRQEFFTFSPTFLILLATNHLPNFRGQDEGLWRRVKLIPFDRFFAKHERDYDLDAKLMSEAAGIIAWAVRGAVDWYASGLRDPDEVSKASQEYRETSDSLAGFFPGALVRQAGARVLGSDVYHAYRDWCDAEGLQSKEIWSRQALYGALKERGIEKVRAAAGMALEGIEFANKAQPATGIGIFAPDSPAVRNFEADMEEIRANTSHTILTQTKLPPIRSRNDPAREIPGQS